MRASDPTRTRILVLAGLFLLLGTADLVDCIRVFRESGSWKIGTQLLMLPAGYGLLRSTAGWLRFARALVAVSMLGTVFVGAMGIARRAGGIVTFGAAAESGAPWWGIVLVAGVLLAIEGVALVWIGRAMNRP